MKMNDDRNTWKLFLGLLAGALLGSIWAALGPPGCASCEGLKSAFGGNTLALLGAGYYLVLLLGAALAGPCLPVFAAVQVAAGVHGSLLALMVQRGEFCAPCVLTGVAAVAALGVSIRLEPANALRASFILPGAAFALQTFLLLGGRGASAESARAQVDAASRATPLLAQAGRVRMVAYTRPDCVYCRDLERDVIPELKREFGERLEIEIRSAAGIPGLPTPTLILTNAARRKLFPGLPPLAELQRAIHELLGGHDGRQALLPEPR